MNNKKFAAFIAVMFVLGVMFSLAFEPLIPDPEELNPKIALKMRNDYRNTKMYPWAEIYIEKYFGNYSGCEVVYMGANLPDHDSFGVVTIADYDIICQDSKPPCAYKNSTFLPVEEAYAEGWLTKEDILAIGQKLNGEEFLKRNSDKIMEIREDFRKLMESENNEEYTLDQVWVAEDFGDYGGCQVVSLKKGDYAKDHNVTYVVEMYTRDIELAGYKITLYNKNWYNVCAYKNSTFLPLEEAYAEGWLTKEDILAIGQQLNGEEFWEFNPKA